MLILSNIYIYNVEIANLLSVLGAGIQNHVLHVIFSMWNEYTEVRTIKPTNPHV